ncbi:MAG: fibronectin type III domain-containing protein, partial [Bacteroidales bacterium]|nr:fibronectin type III domain-containing protein [Bacteroidales bacterium]
MESGVYTLTIPIFMPKETFRLRIKVKDSTELPSETVHTVYYAGISNILIESLSAPDPGPGPDDPEPSCKAALNLQVEDGSLLPDGVTLIWEDENEIAPREYRVLYKEAAEMEWNVEPINRTRLQLTRLRAGGSYTAMVQTYCTYEDSAQSTAITFTLPSIPSCAAPTSLRATHIMSTSVDLSWKGKGQSYAVIYTPREGDVKSDTLYAEETSISLTDLIPDMAYSVYVISYCGEEYTLPSRPSASVYFNTPALCRAPRIEVVENSVTWQGVHLAIIDAPSPDRQIRIIPKDEECPIEKYELTSSKDTVKLYGFIDCENITYLAMVRSICTVDTSEWSESVEFTTLPKPSCGAPSNLQASVDESGRTATVSWTA